MLTSAREQYVEQRRISALALREARRANARGGVAVASVVSSYQYESAGLTFGSMPSILSEQGVEAPTEGRASLSSILTTPSVTVKMLGKAATSAAFDTLVLALVQDAGRTAAAVDIGRRPKLTGYVRSLNPPSCSRCAVLAGRVYRYSTGFQRHPRCDCLMTPVAKGSGDDLVTDPYGLVESGKITGLSKGDLAALDAGADLGRVVNVRRGSGLSVGSSVVSRGGRLTPQGILRIAPDRAQALSLLRRNGYIT